MTAAAYGLKRFSVPTHRYEGCCACQAEVQERAHPKSVSLTMNPRESVTVLFNSTFAGFRSLRQHQKQCGRPRPHAAPFVAAAADNNKSLSLCDGAWNASRTKCRLSGSGGSRPGLTSQALALQPLQKSVLNDRTGSARALTRAPGPARAGTACRRPRPAAYETRSPAPDQLHDVPRDMCSEGHRALVLVLPACARP